MRHIISILIFGLVFLSCQSKKIPIQEQSLIIKMIVDSSFTKDSGLNTNDYWIDFSKANFFDKQAIMVLPIFRQVLILD